ncbi:MAG TPA: MerR family transcriptional regulator [Flavisolibacter sp.]
MKTFSILELEQYSLIKAHTFRTWEQRYERSRSQRKATNIRFYTLEELSFLLDIALLNRLGYKVSSLAALDKNHVQEKVLQLKDDTARQEHTINQLIIHTFSLRIEDVEQILDGAVTTWGIDQTIEEVVLPFLERLQLFSYKGRTSSEYHFVVTALRKKLIVAIAGTTSKETRSASALLFLPEGEHFDLLLLYTAYQLKKAGVNVLYLGTNVSVQNLQIVIETKQPRFVLSYLSTPQEKKIRELSAYVVDDVSVSYFICGPQPMPRAEQLLPNVKYVSYREVTAMLPRALTTSL